MSQENQHQLNINELLEDLRFVNEETEAQIHEVGNKIRKRIDEAGLTQYATDFLIDDISTRLGQIAAKVKITEKAIQSLQAGKKPGTHKDKSGKSSENVLSGELSFPATQLARNKNLLPVEVSTTGVRYCWSGANPEIRFDFSLDRKKKIEIQIRLFALIKPEYFKQLKVIVDGEHIKHRCMLDGGLFVVICKLPASDNTAQTDVKILLPGTHRPSDLGVTQDDRTLGIAISEIRFGKPMSERTYLLKRFRLKK